MERIKIFKKKQYLDIIAILQPFAYSGYVMNFKNQLVMDNAITNCNGKIWLFLNVYIDCVVRDQEEQQITYVSHNELKNQFTMIFVYAKCKDIRSPLRYKMLQKGQIEDKP